MSFKAGVRRPANEMNARLSSVSRQMCAVQQSGTVSPPPVHSGKLSKAHRKSASVDEAGSKGASLPGDAPEKLERKARRKKRAAGEARPMVRKVLFVHVRVNRLHCRATYQARLSSVSKPNDADGANGADQFYAALTY